MTADHSNRALESPQDPQRFDPVAAMPAASFFGFEFRERGEQSASVALPLRDELFQGQARVHGGVIAALADTSAIWLLLRGLLPERTATSIEFKLNFVRPAVAGRGELLAVARLVRAGRTVALVDVDVLQAGELVAKGLFTYLVMPLER
jgi:uncharacterized protein (TIGR00369 family)